MALPVLAVGPILKAIGGFFRAIPLWAWLAFAVLAAAFVYGERKESQGMTRGLAKGLAERDKVQAAWNLAVARGKEEIARIDRENAAAEATAKAEGEAIGERRRRDLQDSIAERDRTIAGLRAGTVRLQDRWASCVSQAQAGDAADLSSGPVRADELRREIAEQISEADDADSRHARLVEFVQVQQKLCEAVQ